MREVTRAEVEGWQCDPEQATLKMSPQVLLALMDGHFVAADGKKARITKVVRWDDGTIDAHLATFE